MVGKPTVELGLLSVCRTSGEYFVCSRGDGMAITLATGTLVTLCPLTGMHSS
jgi:hypothetical protein